MNANRETTKLNHKVDDLFRGLTAFQRTFIMTKLFLWMIAFKIKQVPQRTLDALNRHIENRRAQFTYFLYPVHWIR